MAELARHDGVDARCLAFIILTVSRVGAARLAKWRDIDLERRVWSVPIPDLKDSKHRTAPFVVPLSTAAVELLEALPKRGAFLFPTAVGRPIGGLAILYLMRRLRRRGDWCDPITGEPVTTHGFRATFRTWAKAKRLDREIAELALGHAFYKSSESSYARDDDEVLALRREMLEAWGSSLRRSERRGHRLPQRTRVTARRARRDPRGKGVSEIVARRSRSSACRSGRNAAPH